MTTDGWVSRMVDRQVIASRYGSFTTQREDVADALREAMAEEDTTT